MNWNSSEIAVKPEIMLLEELLGEISSGRLRVPRFQRPFVWRPGQMTDLFDSIERGYPIGSVLIWETPLELPSLDTIAGVSIPSSTGGPYSYVLDGHQRLSTLYGCLVRRPHGSPPPVEPRAQEEWMWEIYRVLGQQDDRANKFRHWKSLDQPPENYLPLRSVLRTMDFLAYARKLSSSDRENINDLIDEGEELALRIKSYKMAVVRLVGSDISHAVEVFSRLNSSGQSMTPDQMVSALTYRADGTESLADRISSIQESLGDVGYGQIPSITIFRSVLAIAGEEDVQEARWDVLADRVKDRLASAVELTEVALRTAVDFLRDEIGVPLARLVPYNAQVMLLSAFFGIAGSASSWQRELLIKWFWSTSWSGFFAGANTTQIKIALEEMKSFASGDADLDLSGQIARPFPDRFDMRSARIRAYLIWELQRFDRRLDSSGRPIDVVGLLARSDSNAYRHVVGSGPMVSNPSNRVVLPTRAGWSVRRSLLELSSDVEFDVIDSHGIPVEALTALRNGDARTFIGERARFLAELERDFMRSVGVQLSKNLQGDADIDAD